MSFLGRIRETVRDWLLPEIRSSLENPQTPLSYPAELLLDIFNGGRTDAGLRVSELTALQVTTVWACVSLVSSAIGFLPFHIYEQTTSADGRRSKRLAPDHDLYDLVRYEPNPEMTSFTFRKTLQAHLLLWGNGYAEIERDAGNRIVALWPRNPYRTRPYRIGSPMVLNGEQFPAGALVYKTTEGTEEQTEVYLAAPQGPERTIAPADMIHLPGLSLDGRLGQSVIQTARQAVGLSLATEKYGAKYFGNGARPGGVIQHPGKLTPESREVLRRSWQEAQGGENAHRVAVLEQGMTWKEAANAPEEAQFLQTRQFQKHEIASIFSVPPHMIGDTEKQNRANTEQIGLEFVTYTLGPWLEAWQQEMKRKCFPKVGRTANKFFVKFETRQLTMPDAEGLRNFITTVKQWGVGSTNDVRELLDWNPIDQPAADELWQPVNMQALGASEPPAATGGGPQPTQGQASLGRLIKAYLPLFRDALGRFLRREERDSGHFRRTFLPLFSSLAGEIAAAAGTEFSREIEPVSEQRFLLEYLNVMEARAGGWKASEAESIADRELGRAVKALAVETYRAAATAIAKERMEVTA
jgi:HK97 family phage portal protein